MTTTTDLLRRAAKLLRIMSPTQTACVPRMHEMIESDEVRASLLALADQMERAEPVAWRALNSLGEVITEWVDGAPPDAFQDAFTGDAVKNVVVQIAYAHPKLKVRELTEPQDLSKDPPPFI